MKKILLTLVAALMVLLPGPSLFAQVTAAFEVSDSIGCTPLAVQFTNTGSNGAGYTYEWFFESAGTSTSENPSKLFINAGVFEVVQVVTNTGTLETDTARRSITVIATPLAKPLDIDSTNACVGGIVVFEAPRSNLDSATWDFGDGRTSKETSSFVRHVYQAQGIYNMTYTTYYNICSDTSNYSIRIDGPVADFRVEPEAACKGEPMTFILGDTTDVQSFSWNVGENSIVLTGDSAVHSYETMGLIYPSLSVTGISGSCTIQDTIEIFQVTAAFTYDESKMCDQQTVVYFNSSVSNDFNYWDLGNGLTSSEINPSTSYDAGNYTVKLKVVSVEGCSDSTEVDIVVNQPPELIFITPPGTTVCPGDSYMLEAEGGDIISWSPPDAFDNPGSYTPVINPESSASYMATIRDTVTQCSNEGSIFIEVQEGFVLGKISVLPEDTAIYTGDTLFVLFTDTLNRQLVFTWTPDVQISCTDCPAPFIIPLETTTYELMVSDDNQCQIAETFTVHAEVTEAYRFGVPDAFTPNGDGRNDEIKVNGVGIRSLIEFRVFNRYGTEVFFSDDINRGWDGNLNGNPQPIDSYAYVIKAEMWDGSIREEKGTFSLLR